MIDCAWCGGDSFTEFRNKRGETFCSQSHRSSSNRALKRLIDRQEHVTCKHCGEEPPIETTEYCEGCTVQAAKAGYPVEFCSVEGESQA